MIKKLFSCVYLAGSLPSNFHLGKRGKPVAHLVDPRDTYQCNPRLEAIARRAELLPDNEVQTLR